MAMGNCFSPVMEGSQFQWNNIVVNSPVYITPIRRKKFKISFGEFDLSKVLSNVSSNCDIIIRDKSAYTFLLLLLFYCYFCLLIILNAVCLIII